MQHLQRTFLFSFLVLGLVLGISYSGVLSDIPEAQAQTGSSGVVSGELRRWHTITVTFDGPQTSEDASPNPFLDYRMEVTFTNGGKTYVVPGFFAADGNAANTSASSGNKWQVRFVPDEVGTWTYTASFRTGTNIAINDNPGTATSFDGASGTFEVAETNKTGDDFRAKGMLRYVGGHHLQFAGSGDYYLKGGADSPENFLGYYEFDGTYDTGGLNPPGSNFLHQYAPHAGDWNSGDPTWAGGKGKNIIGALNYLAGQGMNSVYFLTYNVDGGDGADTWPWIDDDNQSRFDVSKLDQWEIVFSHMDTLGIQLHVVTQETENDHDLGGNGNLNDLRKLYYRELVARFAHHRAVIWNLGEENDNSDAQRIAFAEYIRGLDPYDHPITVHSFYNMKNGFGSGPSDVFYDDLYGNPYFEATAIQGDAVNYNRWARDMRVESAQAGRPWAIYGDEQGPAVNENMTTSNLRTLRENALWGNLMGGGAGVEWYFGYQGPDFGDVQSEDWRRAEPLWQMTDHALDFFQTYLPFWEMEPDNNLARWVNGSPSTPLVLAKEGEIYAVYFEDGNSSASLELDLKNYSGPFSVQWYNPRTGGSLANGSVSQISGPGFQALGQPPGDITQDWAVLISADESVNQAPSANDDTATTDEGVAVWIDVLGNDTDTNGNLDPASVDIVDGRQPENGTITNISRSDGTIEYAPEAGYNGLDTFGYQVCDSEGLCDSATVNVTVGQVDLPPTVNNDSVSTDIDTPVVVDVLANDSDPEGQLNPASVKVVDEPSNGEIGVINSSSGTIEYIPASGFAGSDSFSYEVCDAAPLCGSAIVNVTVVSDQGPMVASFTLVNADTNEDIRTINNGDIINLANLATTNLNVRANTVPEVVGSVFFNAVHPSNSQQRVENVSPYALAGDLSGDYMEWDYSTGDYELTATPYSGSGQGGDEGKALTVSFTIVEDVVVNNPPSAVDDSATTDQDKAVTIDVLANDSDPDGNLDISTLAVTTSPTNGVASVLNDAVTYAPADGFSGTDSFGYEVCDSERLCAAAMVTITVKAVDPPPSDNPKVMSFTLINADTDEDIATLQPGEVIDLTPLGSPNLSIRVNTDPPTVGSVKIVADGPTTTEQVENVLPYAIAGDSYTGDYYPWEYETGDYELMATPFTEAQASGESGTPLNLTFTLIRTVTNDPPDAVNDSASTNQDEAVTVDVLANDSDPDGNLNPNSVFIIQSPSNGQANVNNGAVVYTPNSGYSGGDGFGYQVCDSEGLCDSASVAITVLEKDEPPSNLAVVSFTLVNADTDQDIMVLQDGDSIDLTTIGSPNLSIRANTNPSAVGSVRLVATGPTTENSVENIVPYALNGDNVGDYHPWEYTTGTYQLTATPYTDPNASGEVGTTLTINFTFTQTVVNQPPIAINDTASTKANSPVSINVLANDSDPDGNLNSSSLSIVSSPAQGTASVSGSMVVYTPHSGYSGSDSFGYRVCDTQNTCATASVTVTIQAEQPPPSGRRVTGFTLINSSTEQVIKVLSDGDTIDPAALGATVINIQANTDPATVGSVRFVLTGPTTRTQTENVAPYTLAGDLNGNFFNWEYKAGTYQLTATPYANSGAKGTAGTPKTITFTMTGNSAYQPLPAHEDSRVLPVLNSSSMFAGYPVAWREIVAAVRLNWCLIAENGLV